MNRPAKPTEEQQPFDAGDRGAVNARNKRIEERERRRVAGLKAVVQNDDARLWLWDLMSKCGISRTSFTGNSETFFREGERNIGLKLQADLVRHFPESYVLMMREGESNAA